MHSNGVRVRRDVDAESRVVLAFEAPSGDPEEQRDIVCLVVRDCEVGEPVLVEMARPTGFSPTAPDHDASKTAITPAGQHEDAFPRVLQE